MKNKDFDGVITLHDEDGNGVDFEFLDLIEYKGEEYIVLFPADESNESNDVVILRMEQGEEDDTYIGIDDEETLMAVFEIFKDRVNFDLDVIE